MKKLFYWAMLILSAVTLEAADFEFAKNGKANYVIALPEKLAKYDRQAADELKYYLGKMSGADFKIVPEAKVSASQNAIYVGQSDFARKNKVDFSKLSPETWVIKSAGKNLILSGGNPIGSFYAVWQLLNKFGCYTLTFDQDAIPEHKTLKITLADEVRKPAFEGRMIWDSILKTYLKVDKSVMEAYKKWKLRNGINGKQYNICGKKSLYAHCIHKRCLEFLSKGV